MDDFLDPDAPVSEGTRLLLQSYAVEIVRLRNERDRLRTALEQIAADWQYGPLAKETARQALAPQEAGSSVTQEELEMWGRP